MEDFSAGGGGRDDGIEGRLKRRQNLGFPSGVCWYCLICRFRAFVVHEDWRRGGESESVFSGTGLAWAGFVVYIIRNIRAAPLSHRDDVHYGRVFLLRRRPSTGGGVPMTAFHRPPKLPFSKPWRSHEDQVALLQQRGLVIGNTVAAATYLGHINYYRFSGYCLAFEQTRHQFLPGITFEQIQAAYEFDRVLRDLVTEALEVVELDLRSAIAYQFGRQHGAFGHTNAGSFFGRFRHKEWLDKLHEEAGRSSELFIKHFRATYVEFPDLPIWMAAEVMSFGALSQMFQGMARRDQRAVSVRYRLQHRDLAAWMHHLVYVRNLCAHHSRLWDRVWSIKPLLPAGAAWRRPHLPSNNRLFATLLILSSLLKRCPTMMAFAAQWRQRVESLLDTPPSVNNAHILMGLTANWKVHPCWV